jgi:site-specific recombinase XerD
MVIQNFTISTIRGYTAAIIRLQNHYSTLPEKISETQLVSFICHLKENLGLSKATMHISVAVIKYFYRKVLNKTALIEKIPYPKKEKHIPEILNGSEIRLLINNCQNLKHQLLLKLIYSAGLRRSEIINLSLNDLDRIGMQIIVRQGKGQKDRYSILAHSLLNDLDFYIKQYQPVGRLFYGRIKSGPISASLIRWAMAQALRKAQITKKVNIHSLRHSFASHLLSLNTDVITIQKLLGHGDIRTTMAYLHLNHHPDNKPKSPLDVIYK